MIRLSPDRPLASLADALDMSPDRIALARGVARKVHRASHDRGDHVTVRVLRESVEATGRVLVMWAVEPDSERPPVYHQDRIDRAEREGRGLCEVDCNECGVRADQGPCRQEEETP